MTLTQFKSLLHINYQAEDKTHVCAPCLLMCLMDFNKVYNETTGFDKQIISA